MHPFGKLIAINEAVNEIGVAVAHRNGGRWTCCINFLTSQQKIKLK